MSIDKKKNLKSSKSQKSFSFLADKVIRFFFVISLTVNILTWLLISVKLFTLSSPIILSYNAFLGVNEKGAKYLTVVFPILGLFIIFLNYALGQLFKKDSLVTSRILAATSLLFNLIMIIAVSALIFVNDIY
ncbi:MAG: hypothetical protein GF335_01660 [Candidatus Moranbacteria bacterium]|nr:hypothetical protein [Candidatus Moranbacteria bacterium]